MLKKEKHLGEILGAFLIKPKERSRKKLNKVYRHVSVKSDALPKI